jgi:hypothetical protein
MPYESAVELMGGGGDLLFSFSRRTVSHKISYIYKCSGVIWYNSDVITSVVYTNLLCLIILFEHDSHFIWVDV